MLYQWLLQQWSQFRVWIWIRGRKIYIVATLNICKPAMSRWAGTDVQLLQHSVATDVVMQHFKFYMRAVATDKKSLRCVLQHFMLHVSDATVATVFLEMGVENHSTVSTAWGVKICASQLRCNIYSIYCAVVWTGGWSCNMMGVLQLEWLLQDVFDSN